MAKSKLQGTFDFFNEEPELQPELENEIKKTVLTPPQQVEMEEEEIVLPTISKEETHLSSSEEENTSINEEPQNAQASNKWIEFEPIENEENVLSLNEEKIKTSFERQKEKIKKTDFNIPQHKRPSGVRGRRSAKENSIIADLVEIPSDEELFQKQYYSMGDVTLMFKENHSLIRYWTSEFTILKPKKNKKGDRFFRPEDVKNLQLIHDLLRRKKYTIDGAKEYLKNIKKAEEKFAAIQSLQSIKTFFLELKANL